MNNKAALTAMAALVLLAACGGGSTDNRSAAGNSAGAAPAAPSAGAPVTREALVGTWGQDNCTNTMSFAADGTATSSSAEQSNNRWSLDGSTIVIASPGEPDVRMPATIADGELRISGGGGEGQSTTLTRCEPAAAAAGGESESGNEAEEPAAE